MGRIGLTCRHDVTPRSACKLCKAEDDAMRRPLKRPRKSWMCAARRQGTAGGNDPVDCDWPYCGCDQ